MMPLTRFIHRFGCVASLNHQSANKQQIENDECNAEK